MKRRTSTNFAWYLDGRPIAPGHQSFTIGQMEYITMMHAPKDARKIQMPEISNILFFFVIFVCVLVGENHAPPGKHGKTRKQAEVSFGGVGRIG